MIDYSIINKNKLKFIDKKEFSMKTTNDRFEGLTNNYGELFIEVFAAQGLDYEAFEYTVFEAVKQSQSDFQLLPILDLGVGDGETIKAFVNSGCKDVTGIDLNPEMIQASSKRFGGKMELVQGDITRMPQFIAGQFPIIITAFCIHNIAKEQRKIFWQEIKRLSPKIFVGAEKITDSDEKKHQRALQSEINALKKVYGEKYSLPEILQGWIDHYEYDEQERLEICEIINELSPEYNVQFVSEMGLCKTFIAKKN
jgi:SAM-dependent methyltransferase